jgi:hypothetical protein
MGHMGPWELYREDAEPVWGLWGLLTGIASSKRKYGLLCCNAMQFVKNNNVSEEHNASIIRFEEENKQDTKGSGSEKHCFELLSPLRELQIQLSAYFI